jgi:hypothetical protein
MPERRLFDDRAKCRKQLGLERPRKSAQQYRALRHRFA